MIKITVWALPHTKWRHYMEIITQNEKILYIGIDVHKDTYSLCCFDFFRNEISDEMTIFGFSEFIYAVFSLPIGSKF